MPTKRRAKDGRLFEFPDEMTPEEIDAALVKINHEADAVKLAPKPPKPPFPSRAEHPLTRPRESKPLLPTAQWLESYSGAEKPDPNVLGVARAIENLSYPETVGTGLLATAGLMTLPLSLAVLGGGALTIDQLYETYKKYREAESIPDEYERSAQKAQAVGEAAIGAGPFLAPPAFRAAKAIAGRPRPVTPPRPPPRNITPVQPQLPPAQPPAAVPPSAAAPPPVVTPRPALPPAPTVPPVPPAVPARATPRVPTGGADISQMTPEELIALAQRQMADRANQVAPVINQPPVPPEIPSTPPPIEPEIIPEAPYVPEPINPDLEAFINEKPLIDIEATEVLPEPFQKAISPAPEAPRAPIEPQVLPPFPKTWVSDNLIKPTIDIEATEARPPLELGPAPEPLPEPFQTAVSGPPEAPVAPKITPGYEDIPPGERLPPDIAPQTELERLTGMKDPSGPYRDLTTMPIGPTAPGGYDIPPPPAPPAAPIEPAVPKEKKPRYVKKGREHLKSPARLTWDARIRAMGLDPAEVKRLTPEERRIRGIRLPATRYPGTDLLDAIRESGKIRRPAPEDMGDWEGLSPLEKNLIFTKDQTKKPLDEMYTALSEFGWQFESDDALRQAIIEYFSRRKKKGLPPAVEAEPGAEDYIRSLESEIERLSGKPTGEEPTGELTAPEEGDITFDFTEESTAPTEPENPMLKLAEDKQSILDKLRTELSIPGTGEAASIRRNTARDKALTDLKKSGLSDQEASELVTSVFREAKKAKENPMLKLAEEIRTQGEETRKKSTEEIQQNILQAEDTRVSKRELLGLDKPKKKKPVSLEGFKKEKEEALAMDLFGIPEKERPGIDPKTKRLMSLAKELEDLQSIPERTTEQNIRYLKLQKEIRDLQQAVAPGWRVTELPIENVGPEGLSPEERRELIKPVEKPTGELSPGEMVDRFREDTSIFTKRGFKDKQIQKDAVEMTKWAKRIGEGPLSPQEETRLAADYKKWQDALAEYNRRKAGFLSDRQKNLLTGKEGFEPPDDDSTLGMSLFGMPIWGRGGRKIVSQKKYEYYRDFMDTLKPYADMQKKGELSEKDAAFVGKALDHLDTVMDAPDDPQGKASEYFGFGEKGGAVRPGVGEYTVTKHGDQWAFHEKGYDGVWYIKRMFDSEDAALAYLYRMQRKSGFPAGKSRGKVPGSPESPERSVEERDGKFYVGKEDAQGEWFNVERGPFDNEADAWRWIEKQEDFEYQQHLEGITKKDIYGTPERDKWFHEKRRQDDLKTQLENADREIERIESMKDLLPHHKQMLDDLNRRKEDILTQMSGRLEDQGYRIEPLDNGMFRVEQENPKTGEWTMAKGGFESFDAALNWMNKRLESREHDELYHKPKARSRLQDLKEEIDKIKAKQKKMGTLPPAEIERLRTLNEEYGKLADEIGENEPEFPEESADLFQEPQDPRIPSRQSIIYNRVANSLAEYFEYLTDKEFDDALEYATEQIDLGKTYQEIMEALWKRHRPPGRAKPGDIPEDQVSPDLRGTDWGETIDSPSFKARLNRNPALKKEFEDLDKKMRAYEEIDRLTPREQKKYNELLSEYDTLLNRIMSQTEGQQKLPFEEPDLSSLKEEFGVLDKTPAKPSPVGERVLESLMDYADDFSREAFDSLIEFADEQIDMGKSYEEVMKAIHKRYPQIPPPDDEGPIAALRGTPFDEAMKFGV